MGRKEDKNQCPRCMSLTSFILVHGHYQCLICKSVVDDCCQGETCETSIQTPKDKFDTCIERIDVIRQGFANCFCWSSHRRQVFFCVKNMIPDLL